jgi:hypothetical protein
MSETTFPKCPRCGAVGLRILATNAVWLEVCDCGKLRIAATNPILLESCDSYLSDMQSRADQRDKLLDLCRQFVAGHTSGRAVPAMWLIKQAEAAIAEAEKQR